KKSEKQGDISGLRSQLNALGLKIIEVHADGNCFFRSLSDQLEGNEHEHMKYRTMVVQHILKNREMFEPFIEDDIPFDEYCQSTEKDGTWARNMEVQAASLVTCCNICIHRLKHTILLLHIVFWRHTKHYSSHSLFPYGICHLGGTYIISKARKLVCSICLIMIGNITIVFGEMRTLALDQRGQSLSRLIIFTLLKADADLSANSNQGKVAVTKSKGGVGHNIVKAESIRMVIVGSGCENVEKVEKVLLELGGDVGATTEYLIADQGTEEYLVESEEVTCSAESSHGNGGLDSVKSQETRLVLVAQKRNTSLAVEQLLGDRLLELQCKYLQDFVFSVSMLSY
ncbi:hypothetical protein RJ639_019548, partial [Escallonia herrerae]